MREKKIDSGTQERLRRMFPAPLPTELYGVPAAALSMNSFRHRLCALRLCIFSRPLRASARIQVFTCRSLCSGLYALFVFLILGWPSRAWVSARALCLKSSTSRATRCGVADLMAVFAVSLALALAGAFVRGERASWSSKNGAEGRADTKNGGGPSPKRIISPRISQVM
jgi:hypothetical protein